MATRDHDRQKDTGAFLRAPPCWATFTVTALLILGVFFTTSGNAAPREHIPGRIVADVIRIVDGDTVVIRAQVWLGQTVETWVRFEGVDTPELRGRCEIEKRLAKKAHMFVSERLSGGAVKLRNIHYGKFAGRVVARVMLPNGQDLAESLIAAGLGRAYTGGRRKPWCQ